MRKAFLDEHLLLRLFKQENRRPDEIFQAARHIRRVQHNVDFLRVGRVVQVAEQRVELLHQRVLAQRDRLLVDFVEKLQRVLLHLLDDLNFYLLFRLAKRVVHELRPKCDQILVVLREALGFHVERG